MFLYGCLFDLSFVFSKLFFRTCFFYVVGCCVCVFFVCSKQTHPLSKLFFEIVFKWLCAVCVYMFSLFSVCAAVLFCVCAAVFFVRQPQACETAGQSRSSRPPQALSTVVRDLLSPCRRRSRPPRRGGGRPTLAPRSPRAGPPRRGGGTARTARAPACPPVIVWHCLFRFSWWGGSQRNSFFEF